MAERLTVPVLPLRDVVLFPGITAPINVGRPGTLKAVEAALNDSPAQVFAVTQRDPGELTSTADLYTVGTVAHIGPVHRSIGGIQLLLHGDYRATSIRYVEQEGFIRAVVAQTEDIPPADPDDALFQAMFKEARERAVELGQKSALPQDVVQQVLGSVTEPGRFADLVTSYFELGVRERQELLETISVEERLRRLLLYLHRQIEVSAAQERIKSAVQEELGEQQRQMYLREQLKAIRKELGDAGDDRELEELRQRLLALPLGEAAQKEVVRELARMERVPKEAPEAQVIRTYLENVAELPWGQRTEDLLDLGRAERILDEDHYGLREVKDRVLDFLAVRQLRESHPRPEAEGIPKPAGHEDDRIAKGPLLLFIGPPGTGKTSIAKSIARAMGRKYVRISLGGARDEADIRGHRRTYVGAMPGRILQGMKQAGSKNPVFLLDEIDKLGVSFQGDPAAALLEVLDPAQNDSFTDHYLGVPFDLSEVLFITTANFVQNIPPPLLDRMESVDFAGYTEDEKLAIATRYLLPRQLVENGLTAEELRVESSGIAGIICGYTREAGVRQLERELGRLSRKAARAIAAGTRERLVVGGDDLRELLGRPKIHPERAAADDTIGTATGLYYTQAGGDIMFVEAALMPGKGELVLTGHLGDVMKESARAAVTYAKTRAPALGLPDEALRDREVHVHVPAGAIPKDGPSAGLTIAVALVSALTRRAARHDVAMTGEITLGGRVLPIGGLKEKVLGAVRAGITDVILPKENELELEDLPEEVSRTLRMHPVRTVDEAIELALAVPASRLESVRQPTGMTSSLPS